MAKGRRGLRVVPDGVSTPAVPLAFAPGGLPLTLYAELEHALGRLHGGASSLERIGPDHYRVELQAHDGEVVGYLDAVPPSPRARQREVEYRRKLEHRGSTLDVEPLVSIVVACGYTVIPPQPVGRSLLQWEAPGGLGEQVYVAEWAKGEEER